MKKRLLAKILRISPYESHLRKLTFAKNWLIYLAAVSVNYSDGKFKTSVKGADLKKVVTQATAEIFTQVRRWWKTRDFGSQTDGKTDWGRQHRPEVI